MGVYTERDLEELALLYEHFTHENGNKDAHASNLRACLTDDTSFENGIQIGIAIGTILAALRYWLDHSHEMHEDERKIKIVEKIKDGFFGDFTYQGLVDALNNLADNKIVL